MNIAIYLGNNNGDPVCAKQIEKGNPGVGGAQFCMLQLAHYLNSKDNYSVHLFANREYLVEEGVNFHFVHEESNLCTFVESFGIDILIVKLSESIKNTIAKSSLKIIVWSHNYITPSDCQFIATTPNVKCNVFVGKQQYDNYIDDDVIKKSTFIYNMVQDSCSEERIIKGRKVAFMGVISEGKGFLEMCMVWKKILKKVPDAELVVIGSGTLYGAKELGEYNIAEENYEKKFIPYITENGKILPSVHFLGVLGEDKYQIFSQSMVGVVNPSKCRETFGLSILEMASSYLPVVTMRKGGYLDTLKNGITGFLCENYKEFENRIIELLNDQEVNLRMGVQAKSYLQNFNPNIIGLMWDDLLKSVYIGVYSSKILPLSKPYISEFKYLRYINHILRFRIGLSFIPSVNSIQNAILKIIR